jgi:hypothetical protein
VAFIVDFGVIPMTVRQMDRAGLDVRWANMSYSVYGDLNKSVLRMESGSIANVLLVNAEREVRVYEY